MSSTRRILCYGDSNTWGFDPLSGDRYERDVRWPGVMSQALGPGYEIIEAGLNGRTTAWDDPTEAGRNGLQALPPTLEEHRPLDLVLILLGTNDLKQRFDLSAEEIARGAGLLVRAVQASRAGRDEAAPPVLLLAPPPLGRLSAKADDLAGGPAKSLRFRETYARTAAELGCAFLDTSTLTRSSDIDGVHLEAAEQIRLGMGLSARVKDWFADYPD